MVPEDICKCAGYSSGAEWSPRGLCNIDIVWSCRDIHRELWLVGWMVVSGRGCVLQRWKQGDTQKISNRGLLSTTMDSNGRLVHSSLSFSQHAAAADEYNTTHLTLKVLNFWKFTSYCSLKPLWSGMGEVVPARTSPTLHPPSPPTVHQLSRLAL